MSYSHPCDWSAEELRRVGYRVVDEIARYMTELPERPAFVPVPPAVVDAFMTGPAPQQGAAPEAILDEVVQNHPGGARAESP